MSDIFISYKREEQDEAKKMAAALEREGWSVWWDPKLRVGERFDDVIEAALREARCVIVMWSGRAVKSLYVKDEASYALRRNKLVPVAIESTELPFRFEGLHTPQLIGWDGSSDAPEFRNLVKDIKATLGIPAVPLEPRAQVSRKISNPFARSEHRETKTAPGDIFRDALGDEGEGPEMVVVPAGEFQMGDVWGDGDKNERPVHCVTFAKPFAIARYPVTFEEYDRFVRAVSHEFPGDKGWGRDDRPVVNVSWDDAAAYVRWLRKEAGQAYRLPTEAEWEYAARSGGKRERWSGTSRGGKIAEYAWYETNSDRRTQPVGKKTPNGIGIYDMSGNVWEWTGDPWNENYARAPRDGTNWFAGDEGQPVLRGGSWNSDERDIRTAARSKIHAGNRSGQVGFRVARDL